MLQLAGSGLWLDLMSCVLADLMGCALRLDMVSSQDAACGSQ